VGQLPALGATGSAFVGIASSSDCTTCFSTEMFCPSLGRAGGDLCLILNSE
jgi:hypothetical protein